MAKIVITIEDAEDDQVLVDIKSDPPVNTADLDTATDAQILALGFLAETVLTSIEVKEFWAE